MFYDPFPQDESLTKSAGNVQQEIDEENGWMARYPDFEDEALDAAIAKLEKEAKRLQGEIRRGEGMLSNPGFVNKAPAAKVDAEKEKLENYRKQFDIVSEELNAMKSRRG